MENNNEKQEANNINTYAAFGNALLTSLITILFTVLAALTLGILGSHTSSSSSSWTVILLPTVVIFYIVAMLSLAIIIPVLRTIRYGWRTTLATIMIELVVLFILSLITVWVSGLFDSKDCGYTTKPGTFSTSISSGVSTISQCPYVD